jgi:Holliday junction resolvasome RuvABC DNA-binding subunit
MAGAHVGAVANGNSHVGAPTKLDAAIVRMQTKDALIGLGWKPAIAQAAVIAASAALGAEATLERLIFEALRRCRQRTS